MLPTVNPVGTTKVPVSNRVLSGTRLVAVTVGIAVAVGVVATVEVTVIIGDVVAAVQPAVRLRAITVGTMNLAAVMTPTRAGRAVTLSRILRPDSFTHSPSQTHPHDEGDLLTVSGPDGLMC